MSTNPRAAERLVRGVRLESLISPDPKLGLVTMESPNDPTPSLVLEDDVVIDTHGVRILVESDTASLVEGAQIDFVEGPMRSGFVITNPNFEDESGGCACGGGGCGGGGGGCACGGH